MEVGEEIRLQSFFKGPVDPPSWRRLGGRPAVAAAPRQVSKSSSGPSPATRAPQGDKDSFLGSLKEDIFSTR